MDLSVTTGGTGTNAGTAGTSVAFNSGLTAAVGDTIIVMPGHVETIATAGALALDVAGISIVGLGNKRNRPIIDFTAIRCCWRA